MVKVAVVISKITPRRLRKLQEQAKRVRGWSLPVLAKSLFIDRTTYVKYKSGARPVPRARYGDILKLEAQLNAEEKAERLAHRNEVTILADFKLPAQIQLCHCGKWWNAKGKSKCKHRK